MARNALTAVSAQERARTIPRLHKASTVACGLVKWGKWVWIVVVHSVTRGWQDIVFLLECMGYTTSHTMPDGGVFCHSAMLRRCYLLKNLPQKEGASGRGGFACGRRRGSPALTPFPSMLPRG